MTGNQDLPDASVLESQAERLRADGDLSGARDLLHQAIHAPSSGPSTWANLGLVNYELGNYLEALDAYDHVVEILPDSHNNRGLVFEAMGEIDRAREEYERGLSELPEDVDMLVNLGTLEVQEGNLDRAEVVLQHAARLDARASWQLADVYRFRSEWEKANATLLAALDAGERGALRDLALVNEFAGNSSLADDYLREAMAEDIQHVREIAEEINAHRASHRTQ